MLASLFHKSWIVGFRYVYSDERIIEKQNFPDRLEGSWSFTALPNLRVNLNFHFLTQVKTDCINPKR